MRAECAGRADQRLWRRRDARLAAANLPFPRKPYRIEALKAAIDEALQPLASPEQQTQH